MSGSAPSNQEAAGPNSTHTWLYGIRVPDLCVLAHLTDAERVSYNIEFASLWDVTMKYDKDSSEYLAAMKKLTDMTVRLLSDLLEWVVRETAVAEQRQQLQRNQPRKRGLSSTEQQPQIPSFTLQHVEKYPYLLPPELVRETSEAENKLKEMRHTFAMMFYNAAQSHMSATRLRKAIQKCRDTGQIKSSQMAIELQQLEIELKQRHDALQAFLLAKTDLVQSVRTEAAPTDLQVDLSLRQHSTPKAHRGEPNITPDRPGFIIHDHDSIPYPHMHLKVRDTGDWIYHGPALDLVRPAAPGNINDDDPTYLFALENSSWAKCFNTNDIPREQLRGSLDHFDAFSRARQVANARVTKFETEATKRIFPSGLLYAVGAALRPSTEDLLMDSCHTDATYTPVFPEKKLNSGEEKESDKNDEQRRLVAKTLLDWAHENLEGDLHRAFLAPLARLLAYVHGNWLSEDDNGSSINGTQGNRTCYALTVRTVKRWDEKKKGEESHWHTECHNQWNGLPLPGNATTDFGDNADLRDSNEVDSSASSSGSHPENSESQLSTASATAIPAPKPAATALWQDSQTTVYNFKPETIDSATVSPLPVPLQLNRPFRLLSFLERRSQQVSETRPTQPTMTTRPRRCIRVVAPLAGEGTLFLTTSSDGSRIYEEHVDQLSPGQMGVFWAQGGGGGGGGGDGDGDDDETLPPSSYHFRRNPTEPGEVERSKNSGGGSSSSSSNNNPTISPAMLQRPELHRLLARKPVFAAPEQPNYAERPECHHWTGSGRVLVSLVIGTEEQISAIAARVREGLPAGVVGVEMCVGGVEEALREAERNGPAGGLEGGRSGEEGEGLGELAGSG